MNLYTATNRALLQAWQAGNQQAAQVLFERYMVRLTALAKSRLSRRLSRRVDPEDVVLSAWRSFFVAHGAGDLLTPSDDNLWPLLVTITLRKLSRQVAFHTAQQRDVWGEVASASEMSLPEAIATDPGPEEAAMLSEHLEQMLQALSEGEREIVVRRLQGSTPQEITAELGCSDRTVRRAMARCKEWLSGDQPATQPQSARHLDKQANAEKQIPLTVFPDSHARPEFVQTNKEIEQSPVRGAGVSDIHAQPPSLIPADQLVLQHFAGQGGFGKVYQATWTGHPQPVAVKYLRKRYWHNAPVMDGLVQETRVIASLSHPNIVRHFGWGHTSQGAVYLVMEWVSGQTAAHWATTARPPLSEILACGCAVASALVAAHQAGFIHGDLTPANVLREQTGRFVVTDFGLRSNAMDAPALYGGGTPGFLAPEQVSPVFGPISERTDIYGLGAVLFALCAGRPPITGPDRARMFEELISSRPTSRLRDFCPDVPAAVDALVAACLQKEPSDRPDSMREVWKALTKCSAQLNEGF